MSYSVDHFTMEIADGSPALEAIITMEPSVREKLADLCIRAGSFDVTMIARIWDEAVEYFTPDGYLPNTSDIVRGYYRLIETGRLYQAG